MINILIFVWIFIIPILGFIWGIFHKEEKIFYKLDKSENQKLKRYFWGAPLIFFILLMAIFFQSGDNFNEFLKHLSSYFSSSFQILFYEIMFFDAYSLLFLWREMHFSNLDEKWRFSFSWIKKNWGWFRLLLPYYILFFLSPIYIIITLMFVFDLSLFVCRVLIFIYPICTYFKTKDAYAIFRFYQQKRFQEKCDRTLNLLTKREKLNGKTTHSRKATE